MHTGRPTDGDNNRSCWPQTPRRSGRSPLRQGSHKEWHVCRLPLGVGLKGGWQHAGSAAWSVLLVVPAGLSAACEWALLCQLHLGQGWPGSTPSLVTCMCLPAHCLPLQCSRHVLSQDSAHLQEVSYEHPGPVSRLGPRAPSSPLCSETVDLSIGAQSRYPPGSTDLGRAMSLEPLCQ